MSTMNSEVYDAFIDAGADENKARQAAKSVVQHDSDLTKIKASLRVIKWMVGFVLALGRRPDLGGVPIEGLPFHVVGHQRPSRLICWRSVR